MSILLSTRTALTGAVVVAAMVTGCHPANPVVGKWQITKTLMGAQVTVTREFKADGTELLLNPGGMDAEMAYTIDGNQLHEHATAITIGGHTLKIDSTSPANVQKEIIEKFTVDGDKLTLDSNTTGVSVTQTYTRVPG